MASNDGESLPDSFDFVVVGTGMVECVLAGAFARVGYSVLHIDRNEYYGGTYASFNLRSFQKWAEQSDEGLPSPDISEVDLSDGQIVVQCPTSNSLVSDVTIQYFVRSAQGTCHPVTGEEALTHSLANITTTDSSPIVVAPEVLVENGDIMAHDPVESNEDLTSSSEPQSPHTIEVVEEEQASRVDQNSSQRGEIENSEDAVETVTSHTEDAVETVTSHTEVVGEQGAAGHAWVDGSRNVWSVESIEGEWRRFNLDLSPRLLYCRGELVELLISSDVGKYCEFKTVDQMLTVREGSLELVPCSRADVFSCNISMIEKRMLMRFMQFCLEFDANSERVSEIPDESFRAFLQRRHLSDNICHYILHAIAMATDETTAVEGLCATRKFFRSLGRYGNTAFLWPLYGSGELPQCFARLCAVFGGVYCLRTSVTAIIVDSTDNRSQSVMLTNGQRITSRWLVMDCSYTPVTYLNRDISPRYVSRAIIMCDCPIYGTDANQVKLLRVPCPDNSQCPVTVLQLSASTMVCPRNMIIVHLTRECLAGPQSDLSYVTSLLFQSGEEESDKPRILWSCYFKMIDMSEVRVSGAQPTNVISVGGSGVAIDSDACVTKAKAIFQEICPDDEFLPKAPNPEDIVYDFGGGGASESLANGPIEGIVEGVEVPGEGGDAVVGVEDMPEGGEDGVGH